MEDIQKTMPDFYGNLKGKSIYMPCDNQDSNFVRYFKENQAVAGIERMGFSSLENGKQQIVAVLPLDSCRYCGNL